jgi:hypothetical protein
MEVKVYTMEGGMDLMFSLEEKERYERLVEELGLSGQRIYTTNAGGTVIPFPACTTQMFESIKALFTESCEPDEFKHEVIPIRVLELIKLCRDENYFNGMKIYYSRVIADPVLIGTKDRVNYLVAKWGDSLMTDQEILSEGYKAKRADIERRAKEKMKEMQDTLSDLDGAVEKAMERGWWYA